MNIDVDQPVDEEFDRTYGDSAGAGVIFGTTGGVMEAALRTVYEHITGDTLEKVEFEAVRGWEGIKKANVTINGITLNIGVAYGLGNARKLMNEIRAGKSEFHAIEVMACPGGCIGGGGQPFHHGDINVLKARAEALYSDDRSKELRKSHLNPYIKDLYACHLGKPLGHEAHHLLHTHYHAKDQN